MPAKPPSWSPASGKSKTLPALRVLVSAPRRPAPAALNPAISWLAGFATAFLVYAFGVLEREPRNPAILLLALAAGFLVGFLSRHFPLRGLFTKSKAREPASPEDAKPFGFDGHLLYRRTILNKDGSERMLYFFTKVQPPAGAIPAPLPAGYMVALNPRTDQPFLCKAPRRQWGFGPRGTSSGAER